MGKVVEREFFAKTLPEIVFLDGLFFSLCVAKDLKVCINCTLRLWIIKHLVRQIFQKMVLSGFKLDDTAHIFFAWACIKFLNLRGFHLIVISFWCFLWRAVAMSQTLSSLLPKFYTFRNYYSQLLKILIIILKIVLIGACLPSTFFKLNSASTSQK